VSKGLLKFLSAFRDLNFQNNTLNHVLLPDVKNAALSSGNRSLESGPQIWLLD
jgi:hypothetical protein